jgi:hypothetical protein
MALVLPVLPPATSTSPVASRVKVLVVRKPIVGVEAPTTPSAAAADRRPPPTDEPGVAVAADHQHAPVDQEAGGGKLAGGAHAGPSGSNRRHERPDRC